MSIWTRLRAPIALMLAVSLIVVGVVSDRLAALFVVGAVAVVAASLVWVIRVFGTAHTAWARGLYGSDDGDTDDGYANAVRRHAQPPGN